MRNLSIILTLLLLVLSSKLYAQTDTTTISYSTEDADSSNYNYQRQYQYLDFSKMTEKNLIKLGVTALKRNNEYNLSYERKIAQSFSLSLDIISTMSLDFRVGGKYFFLMKNRIKKGLAGNNLSGVYVGTNLNIIKYTFEFKQNPISGYVALGIQKRLTWFSYFDASVFAGTTNYNYDQNNGYIFGLRGTVGFAWGWGNKY